MVIEDVVIEDVVMDRSGCEIWCLWVYKVNESLSVGASCLIMLDVL